MDISVVLWDDYGCALHFRREDTSMTESVGTWTLIPYWIEPKTDFSTADMWLRNIDERRAKANKGSLDIGKLLREARDEN